MKLDVDEVFASSESENEEEILEDSFELENDEETSEIETDGSSYNPNDSFNTSGTISEENDTEVLWYLKRPREYTGIPKESLHIIDILRKFINCSAEEIYIVLVKIRKNYTNTDMADRFCVNEKRIRSIFASRLPSIAEVLKHFKQWPSLREIKMTLPIAFRRNFRKVQAIIDAFEIEIQKPTDPVLQALTWSDYKKCNTLKYLVVSLPNGQIIFISDGYGGRISDIELTTRSDFLAKLPEGAHVLTDIGFKGVESLLREQGCKLVRPPSLRSGTKMSKSDVRKTKQVASIRIHIERAIRRVREFYMLKPHSCVHHDTMKYMDHCLIVACGIINLQPALIKYTD